jgi:hypothetical protein
MASDTAAGAHKRERRYIGSGANGRRSGQNSRWIDECRRMKPGCLESIGDAFAHLVPSYGAVKRKTLRSKALLNAVNGPDHRNTFKDGAT